MSYLKYFVSLTRNKLIMISSVFFSLTPWKQLINCIPTVQDNF